jgi:hypothetical protein
MDRVSKSSAMRHPPMAVRWPEGARAMTELRCERGAEIARMIELSASTAAATPVIPPAPRAAR